VRQALDGVRHGQALSAKARAIGGSLKVEKRSTHAFVETMQRLSNVGRTSFSSAADIGPPPTSWAASSAIA
jgi:hypothetical protein